MKKLTLFLLFFAPLVQSAEMSLSYDGFYDRLKEVNSNDYQDIGIGFYLIHVETKNRCHIKSGEILTERKSYPLTYKNGELFLPFNKQLDKDKAVVIVDTKERYGSCVLQMQIQSLTEFDKQISFNDINKIYEQQALLLDDLGGMMSFLMPSVKGVTFELERLASFKDKEMGKDKGISCEANKCTLKMNDVKQFESLNFDSKILKVIPYIAK